MIQVPEPTRRRQRTKVTSGQEHLVEQFLTQFYGEQAELGGAADEATNPVPREVLVPVLPPNADELAAWLSGLRGSRVSLRVPVRGDKRTLAETVQRNAREALAQHKLKRAGDFNARSEALQSIQDSLGLADAPLRIESRGHQPCAGHGRGRLAGGVRGRSAAKVGLPPLCDPPKPPVKGDRMTSPRSPR